MIAAALRAKAAPYLVWIVLAAIAAAGLAGLYYGNRIGTEHQQVKDAAAIKAKDDLIGRKNTALRDAAVALRAASGSINAINAEAARRVAAAEAGRARAEEAGRLAQAAERDLRRRFAALDAQLAATRATGSDRCKALLGLDVSLLRECLP